MMYMAANMNKVNVIRGEVQKAKTKPKQSVGQQWTLMMKQELEPKENTALSRAFLVKSDGNVRGGYVPCLYEVVSVDPDI